MVILLFENFALTFPIWGLYHFISEPKLQTVPNWLYIPHSKPSLRNQEMEQRNPMKAGGD